MNNATLRNLTAAELASHVEQGGVLPPGAVVHLAQRVADCNAITNAFDLDDPLEDIAEATAQPLQRWQGTPC